VNDILIAAADVVADHQSRGLRAVDQHDARAEPSRCLDRWLTECRRRDEDALVGLLKAERTEEVPDCAGANVAFRTRSSRSAAKAPVMAA
jgi:hypothetical protein